MAKDGAGAVERQRGGVRGRVKCMRGRVRGCVKGMSGRVRGRVKREACVRIRLLQW